jgi:hypothetical protein
MDASVDYTQTNPLDAEPEDDGEEMDEQDTLSLVVGMLEEAQQFYEGDVEPVQAKATDYYLGAEFGNEMRGRSKVVSTDVRDTVQAILPSFMRIVFGPEKVLEFKPRGAEDVEVAAQQTDYINYIIREDNPGFMIMHAWLKDAFVRKLGIVKWDYVERDRVLTTRHSGIGAEQLAVLADEGDVEILKEYPNPAANSDPQAALTLYDCELVRRVQENRIVISNVPNEEFLVNPSARSIADARFIAHVREMKAYELIEMGIDEDVIETAKGKLRDMSSDQLRQARTIDAGSNTSNDEEQDEETRPVEYAECYVLLERDENVQLRKVCIVGRSEIVYDEATDERPFAVYCPDPEPHTLYGQSLADYTMDLQLIKSMIMRGMLDSLNLTLNPRTEIVDGYVNVPDLLNPEIGGIIRSRAPGMMREVKHDFVGREAMPVLGYVDEVKENRVGISKASAGLDADALQSSTKAAVAATISAAQQHIELLVRIFAETALKDLFTGVLRTVVKHQDHARTVRLRNEWVEIDPRSWDAQMDVQVNVALGAGTSEEKVQILSGILQSQMGLLQMPGQPLVGFAEVRNTLGRLAELSGLPRSTDFYKPFTSQDEQAMEQQKAQQPPPQDPTVQALQMQLQIEQQKAQLQGQAEQAKHMREMQKLQMEDDRERDKIAREFALKQQELELKYGIAAAQADAAARTERERLIMDQNNQQQNDTESMA